MAVSDDLRDVAALRSGDEATFERWVQTHHTALARLASHYVSASVADEVVQETWLAFLHSLERFEGRSSLKTWLFRTLLNCARNRRRKESRSIPFSALFDANGPDASPVDETRFERAGPRAGAWSAPPRSFGEDGEHKLLRVELGAQLQEAVNALPPAQREVIVLRDVEGWESQEVCEVLGVSEANQRVLLHRARARVRSELERYLSGAQGQLDSHANDR
jgi:RNA polymerase sigma-70 factor (ECF subfamily)